MRRPQSLRFKRIVAGDAREDAATIRIGIYEISNGRIPPWVALRALMAAFVGNARFDVPPYRTFDNGFRRYAATADFFLGREGLIG